MKHRKTQRNSDEHRETQRKTEKHRESKVRKGAVKPQCGCTHVFFSFQREKRDEEGKGEKKARKREVFIKFE